MISHFVEQKDSEIALNASLFMARLFGNGVLATRLKDHSTSKPLFLAGSKHAFGIPAPFRTIDESSPLCNGKFNTRLSLDMPGDLGKYMTVFRLFLVLLRFFIFYSPQATDVVLKSNSNEPASSVTTHQPSMHQAP